MAFRSRKLSGPGWRSGNGFDAQVHYSLLHRSQDVANGSILDSVTGRVEIAAGLSLPAGETMILSLHDGNRLKVITEPDGCVSGIGGFFR